MSADRYTERMNRALSVHRALVDPGTSVAITPPPAADGTVQLRPPTQLPPASLGTVLRQRRSHYRFGELDPDDLSTLLRWALGPGRTVGTEGIAAQALRLNPSAGGLRSIDVHLVVLRGVDDIGIGTYLFDPATHRLLRTSAGDTAESLGTCLVQPEFASRAAVLIVLVGRLDVTLTKYSERHYRTLHVDAGIAAQNLYLVGTALNVACCAISGFHDDLIATVIRAQPGSVPLLAFALGGGGQLGEHR